MTLESGTLDAPSLLQKAQKVIVVEKVLSDALERATPYLISGSDRTDSNITPSPHLPRVRPIPTNMDQVNRVLALARPYAARTSAPSGWNPQAPVLGFSVPNPLPHQLRGGALAQGQLERAQAKAKKELVRQRNKRRMEEEEAKKLAEATSKAETDANANMNADETNNTDPAKPTSNTEQHDAKRREVNQYDQHVHKQQKKDHQSSNQASSNMAAPASQPRVEVSMNLSDSSSDEDSE